ncbi:YybH family protein [Micromonospora sp. SL1-18]|uniref:YybH family protein n=1 Tax=Micromonospora sp. SL1-18 TaxID=3399128 RepID=UPI003A4E1FD5
MTDQQALRSIRDLVAAANRHQSDVAEFVALHHSDVVVVNVAGRRVLGRKALREAMTAGLNSPLAKVLTHLEIEDIRFVGPDVALVSCAKRISDERGEGPAVPTRGSLTFTVVREPDGWKIALAQTTPVS